MAKTNVKINFRITEIMNRFMNATTEELIGSSIVELAKDMIAAGQSPVRGKGRFEGYKAVVNATALKKEAKASKKASNEKSRKLSRQADLRKKKGYPESVRGKFPDKKDRPVNLDLSGEMLKYLDWSKGSRPNSIKVGIIKATQAVYDRAEAHNFGTNPNVPRRQFIPEGDEEWAVSIMNAIKDIYQRRLEQIIEESEK